MNSCGCNDWQATHRRSMLRRGGQVVPIPRAVLEGETAGMCRRDFLKNGAVAFLTVYGASMMSWGKIWEAAAAQAATPSTDPIIVSVFLDGGNDGLNTLVPVTGSDYAAYVTKRPNIGLKPANCLPLAGPAATPDWRWNPAATGFQQLYDAGKLAVIPAVDYMPPDLSHFHSRAFWQAGELDPDPDTGWLGRWIDQNGDPDNPLQAISAGLVAGRRPEDGVQAGGGAVERGRRPVLAEQRVERPAADDGHAGGAAPAKRRQPGHGRGRQRRRRRRQRRQPAEGAVPADAAADRARLRRQRLRPADGQPGLAARLQPGHAGGLRLVRRRLGLPRLAAVAAGRATCPGCPPRWPPSRPTWRRAAWPTG